MDQRIVYLLIGCVIGFVLGYIVKSLRELKEEIVEVHKDVNEQKAAHDEGFTKNSLLTNVALAIVVIFVAIASFQSQNSSNDVKDTQARQKQSAICTQDYLSKTITALNVRTQFSSAQAMANINLQKAQSKFLGSFILTKPPSNATLSALSLNEYFMALTTFITLAGKTNLNVKNNPYPTTSEFMDCLSKK